MAIISWDNYVDDATITNNSGLEAPDGATNYAGVYYDGATSPALTGVTNATDSWDMAEAWVGNQSLKIIATGTDAAVYLGSGATDYNINIPAGRKWVYSFYVKLLSTNSPLTTDNVDGFIRKSSDGGFENIGIQNVPADGAWHRVYGTIDLTGDTSTSVLMRVDNDSYNGADTTMYIDGIRFELDTVENLKTRQIGQVFRQGFDLTSPLDELIIDFDLGSAKETNLIGILNHNMAGYSYTISFGTSSGASDVGTESGTFWSGTAYDSPNELIYLSTALTARYIRLAVAIPAAVSVDIGRVWLDSAWSYNNAMDFSIGIVDRSTKTKSRAGSSYVSNRQKLRQLDIRAYGRSNDDFYGDSSDTLMSSFLTMDLAVGMSGEVICIPMTESKHAIQRSGVYGTISRNGPIRVKDKGANGYLSEKQFTIEEDKG